MAEPVTVVGGGLAGCECALQLADRGIDVVLVEQRPHVASPAHKTDGLAELVCSNSFKSMRPDTAAGTLKCELMMMGSRLLHVANECAVPAGGALAVDRDAFSAEVTRLVVQHPHITLVRKEITEIPDGYSVLAAGPLCSQALFSALVDRLGTQALSFFDAAAPIVDAASLDQSALFFQSRYAEQGQNDYLNCPMNREEYERWHGELIAARRVVMHDFEQKDLFSACQPIEEVARTGIDSLRFGALKPVGLEDPRTGKRPWAVVQLRAETRDALAYNLVGFQTNLKFSEQKRVFSYLPGFQHAEFVRYGVMHRNSFVDAPHTLDATFAIPKTRTRLAGQITGTEGYTEAIASGLLAALNTYADYIGAASVTLPRTTAFGSLVAYATDPATKNYQPMHVNFGIIAPLETSLSKKRERYAAYAERARADLASYLRTRSDLTTTARYNAECVLGTL